MTTKDEQVRKKKKKANTGSPWLVVGILAGIAVVVGVVLLIVFMNRDRGGDAQAKGKPPEPAPPGQPVQGQPVQGANDGGRFKPIPNPQGVVQNVRAAAMRVDRQNEMKSIGQYFHLFVNDFNRNPRTEQEFAKYLQRDLPKLAEAINEKYYVLNLKAKVGSGGVIAYEELLDAGSHLAVRTDGSVALIPPDELKKLLTQ